MGPSVVAALNQAVSDHKSDLLSCHGQRLGAGAGGEGFLMLRVSAAKGVVSGAQVTANTTGDDELGSCVSEKVKGWKLPTFVDGDESVRATFKSQETMVWAANSVVRQKTGSLDAACTRDLPPGTDLLGTRLTLAVSVAQGAVGSVRVQSDTTGVTGLGPCVTEAVKGWTFPPWVTVDLTVTKGW